MSRKTGNIILAIIIAIILCIGLGAWLEDFISNEKDVQSSPLIYGEQEYTEPYIVEGQSSKVVDDNSKEEEKIPKGKIPFGVNKYEVRLSSKFPTMQNALSSINGIPVNNCGEFKIKIKNVDFNIRCVIVRCPNEDCREHKWGDCNFIYLDGKKECVCDKCKTPLEYSSKGIKAFHYWCPVCGHSDCMTYDSENFCSNCGTDMRPYSKLLMNYKWESK